MVHLLNVQVLGTSMVEEYEGQQQPEEEEIDPYEEALDGDKKRIPESGDKSIIAGARSKYYIHYLL